MIKQLWKRMLAWKASVLTYIRRVIMRCANENQNQSSARKVNRMENHLGLAKNIHYRTHFLFHYVHDDKNYQMTEHWTSHADDVNKGRQFEDDCDGFALTCAELLIEAGVPKDQIKAIICTTETGEGHLVCGLDYGDNTYILENRYRFVYNWKEATRIGYKWHYYMSFDEPGVWNQVTNATTTS